MEKQLDIFEKNKEKTFPINFKTRESDVTKVVTSGIVMRPVYELVSKRFENRIAEYIDIMWLAFAVLDTVSELTEIKNGATRREVVENVFSPAMEMAELRGITPDKEDLKDLINKIFYHLVNRDNRYFPFEYEFFNGSEKRFETRKFWLIKNVYTGFGKEAIFSLTDEGYSAYFGLYETSALDAAAIGNLRIKMFIERGNIDDAIRIADQNQKQCLRKAREIKNIRRSIKRNILSIDFEKINNTADQGARQAIEIQQESSRLYNVVNENIQSEVVENLKEKFYQLGDQLQELNSRQMDLISEIQNLPEDFHNNSHRLLRKRSHGIYPSGEDLLKKAAKMDERNAVKAGEEFIASFDPPKRNVLFDPGSMIDAIESALEKYGSEEKNFNILQEIDGEKVDVFQSELSEEIMNKAYCHLQKEAFEEKSISLKDLLLKKTDDEEDILSAGLCMAVFQCIVDSNISKRNNINIELKKPVEIFSAELPCGRTYTGHDLTIYRTEKGKDE